MKFSGSRGVELKINRGLRFVLKPCGFLNMLAELHQNLFVVATIEADAQRAGPCQFCWAHVQVALSVVRRLLNLRLPPEEALPIDIAICCRIAEESRTQAGK